MTKQSNAQRVTQEAVPSSEGFILLDASMNPILVSRAAAQILIYPQNPETQENLDNHLATRVASALFAKQSSHGLTLVPRFQSGRRTYRCRYFHGDSMANGQAQASFAVLLERASEPRSSPLSELSERFHLTTREQEVTGLILQGLTSKEIAVRMEVSPNTVKAFLRLIMVKMGVSTRSGIVGRALCSTPRCKSES